MIELKPFTFEHNARNLPHYGLDLRGVELVRPDDCLKRSARLRFVCNQDRLFIRQGLNLLNLKEMLRIYSRQLPPSIVHELLL